MEQRRVSKLLDRPQVERLLSRLADLEVEADVHWRPASGYEVWVPEAHHFAVERYCERFL